ncbi:MAG: AAA family ATPase [Bacteroidaceae bacterium]|nr:AAA family ATPase [Bacteroidaceae bacterium]
MSTSNPELDLAWRIVENTGMHMFLTGKAGTGKTTFLKELKRRSPKRMVVTAPTGIAAINAEGMTLHSFFQLPFAPYIPDTVFNAGKDAYRYRFSKEKIRIIRSIDLLVIDEISMVRADLLDAVDSVLRRYRSSHLPFGGVQLLMIGDLQQLAPVVKAEEWELLSKHYDTPYFFSSRALAETQYATIELKQTYRQTDAHFLNLLNRVRTNTADRRVLEELNRRYKPQFVPPKEERYIRLTTHNILAQNINERELGKIDRPTFVFNAVITGKFPEYSYPTDETLTLKQGAQIMFVKNDRSPEKRYFNGMIGEITAIDEKGFYVRSKDYPEEIRVEQEQWDNSRYTLNEKTMEITEEIEGTFSQFPVRLAWAITIHKSQGLTFSHAIIDAHDSFAHGQVYVALSRCRTLEGMVLSTPLGSGAIICDNTVERYTSGIERRTPSGDNIGEWEKRYFHQLLSELFGFSQVSQCFEDVQRLLVEHFHRLYPQTLESFNALSPVLQEKITDVSLRFANQYTRLVSEQADFASSTLLQQRLMQGATYFAQELLPFVELAQGLSLPTDNKTLKKRVDETTDKFRHAVSLKHSLLEHVREHGFQTGDYLKRKAILALEAEEEETSAPAKKSAKKSKETKLEVPEDILYPNLYKHITMWRGKKAREAGLPAYCILQQKAILGIVNLLPDTPKALHRIPYLGKVNIEKYGDELLEIICRYMKDNDLKTNI